MEKSYKGNFYKNLNQSFLKPRYLLFIEDEINPTLNRYIIENYEKISKAVESKEMEFIYFPFISKATNEFIFSLTDFLKYKHPILYSFNAKEIKNIIAFLISSTEPLEFYSIVLKEIGLSRIEHSGLIRNFEGAPEFDSKKKFSFVYPSGSTYAEYEMFFESFISQLLIPSKIPQTIFYQLAEESKPNSYDADWYFSKESNIASDELKLLIDSFQKEGKYALLADAVMYMLSSLKDNQPEFIKKVKPIIEHKQLLDTDVILSKIMVDNHYNIFLPDFGNREIKMHALPKSLYLLFLRYPNGIRFKELYEYKKELLEIYNKVTNKYEKEEIVRAIDDLVDMTKNSINEKCSRIREAFVSIMDDNTAKHYYITGERGKPKKILLPNKLIDIRY
ncbi:MAG TPA: hypothetical protein PLY81_01595 [Chitinophagaceae bacterium]|nr:hypothetical protein [Chitinophagaceae bacterium]HNF28955.1 hypothetical protein [Chitinophagaceae bacterium]HNM33373.1 hypothetical protein [Chitinophagaceae bacterium]HNO49123.1 hypothetical protein [Chitinophagales bacterium]